METKTNEPVKQEGEFKIRKKTTPKKLVETKDNVTKVNINSKEPLVEVPNNVTKVEIKKQEDAIQIGETKEVPVEKPSGNSAEMGESVQESNETTEGFSPIKEVTEEEVREVKEAIRDERVLGKALPENIEKLVSFMEETGGTIEDYTRLNADYTNVDDDILLKEYYKKSKPHLDLEEINFIMEENFDYDTDLDEEREVKKKKLAKKEEIAKAKNFFKAVDEVSFDSNIEHLNFFPEELKNAEKNLLDINSEDDKSILLFVEGENKEITKERNLDLLFLLKSLKEENKITKYSNHSLLNLAERDITNKKRVWNDFWKKNQKILKKKIDNFSFLEQ